MLQGRNFFLLVHLSRVKSELLESFYHIEGVKRMWRRAGRQKEGAGPSPAPTNVKEKNIVDLF